MAVVSVTRMLVPADTPIRVGQAHRPYQTLWVRLYVFDALGVEDQFIKTKDVFQPWEPPQGWRGALVPITLGDGAQGFEWGPGAPPGRFLHWDDFFAFCGTGEVPRRGINEGVKYPGERWPAPFAQLPQIAERLRARARAEVKPQLEEMLNDLEVVAQKHADAASAERWAMGVDNTTNMKIYAAEQDVLLAEAKAKLEACRKLLA